MTDNCGRIWGSPKPGGVFFFKRGKGKERNRNVDNLEFLLLSGFSEKVYQSR